MKYGVLITIIILAMAASGCKKVLDPRVKYFVDGTSTNYTVTYLDAAGDSITLDTVPYNWSVSFEGEKDMPLMIAATAHENDCWVKVYIYIDGKLLNSNYQYGDRLTARLEEKLRLVF